MDITEFWKLIDKTREAANGDARKQSDLLTEQLAKLPEYDIILFDQIFDDLKDKAYIGNLWDAAFIMMHYCGDSCFEEFREWLIGRGKDAYERVTGKDMPPMPRERAQLRDKLTGDAYADKILERFPKLTSKFWEWWTRDKIYLEIRDILREMLIPLGFSEEEIKSLAVVKFQRKPFTVEIMLDSDDYEPYFALYVSSELSETGYPIHQPAMVFSYHEYDNEKKKTIHASIHEWLVTVGL